MFTIDKNSKTPIYLQITLWIKSQILTANILPHTPLASVRSFAKELKINPNTVQKAYAVLKEENFIYSVAGKGDFVSDNTHKLKELNKIEVTKKLVLIAKEAKACGMWIDEVILIIDNAFSQK